MDASGERLDPTGAGRMTRRRFLGWLAAAGAVALSGRIVHGLRSERWALRVVPRDLLVPQLPPALDGLRIVHLSDLHAGDYSPWWLAERAVALAAQQKADLAFLTGDYASLYGPEARRPLEKALASLSAPAGVWAVLGNHEYVQARREPVIEALSAAGATVLLNQSRQIEVRGEKLWVCGVEDPFLKHHDFEATLEKVPQADLKVLLAHSPDIIYSAAQLGIAAVFAGHTHGGQVSLPLYGPPIVPSRYGRRFAYGAFQVHGTGLYVTRGVGMTPPLVRFLCPPEVALITLRRAVKGPRAG